MEYRGMGTNINRNNAYNFFKYAGTIVHIFAYKAHAVMLIRGYRGLVGRLKGLLMYFYILHKGSYFRCNKTQ